MLAVAGIIPFTTVDFPNHLSAVVFLKGCPLRCPFCYNPDLQTSGEGDISWTEVENFLQKRRALLNGVVFSGGEPLMQKQLHKALTCARDLGYKAALHTAGTYPEHLKKVLPLLDWVGLDVKSPWDKYAAASGRPGIAAAVRESLGILLKSGVPFECRTTCDPRFLTREDILSIARGLAQKGVKTYAIQKYKTFDRDKNPPSAAAIDAFFWDKALLDELESLFDHFVARS